MPLGQSPASHQSLKYRYKKLVSLAQSCLKPGIHRSLAIVRWFGELGESRFQRVVLLLASELAGSWLLLG